MILYSPLYVGDGGLTGDAVADASTEQQAIGRVFRPGQLRPEVSVFRIEPRGPLSRWIFDSTQYGWMKRFSLQQQMQAICEGPSDGAPRGGRERASY